MSFKIRLHPDAVKFLVDLNSEAKERLRAGIKGRSRATGENVGCEN